MPPPEELTREFAASEKALWSGQPRQGIVFRAFDIFVVPFSLLWCGMAVFVFVMTLRAPKVPPFPFEIMPLIFVLVGLYIVVGRFWVDAKQRARTFYAITNDRIIIVSGMFSRNVKSIDLRSLGEMALSERKSGNGSIVFGQSSPFDWIAGGMPAWPSMPGRFASRFDLIGDVRSVYNTIKTAQRALSP